MSSLRWCLAVGGLAFLPSFEVSSPPTPDAKPIKLTKKKVKEGERILAHGLKGDVPKESYLAKIGKTQYLFFDLDANGQLEVAVDGIAMPDYPFIVPIPERLLDPKGQYIVRFEGVAELHIEAEELGLPSDLIEGAAQLTRIRIASGVSPIALSKEASAHCDLHADYLKTHNMHSGYMNAKAAMTLHDEDPDLEGYTPEGAAAGRNSCLGFQESDYGQALDEWYASAYHRWPLIDPTLLEFGATTKHGVVAYYAWTKGAPALDGPQLTPAIGAMDVPLAFGASGEAPNPVPNTEFARGCGFPVSIWSATSLGELTEATVVDVKRKKPIEGTISCTVKPASNLFPSNARSALFIPSGPLKGRTLYEATFTFASGKVHQWRFTTRSK